MEPIGKRNKDGVIMKCDNGFNYYFGMNDNGLRPILKQGSKAGQKVKTIKVYEPVKIANNRISVTVYPDGRVELEPSV